MGRRAGLALSTFLAGAGLIVVFDMPAVRMAGLAGLIAAIVLGTSVIVTPATPAAEDASVDEEPT